ncbi:MAG: hypothetical protein QOE70_4123 [Chthoniobacter sp.]|nr:hypothetical protein [Chthoniobacter sp.]
MSEHHHSHLYRERQARLLVCLVFVLLRAADALVIYYSFFPSNPLPFLRGLTVGSVLWTTVLLGGVWRRQVWARYFLIGVNWCFIALLSYPLLLAWGRSEPAASSPYLLIAGGLLLYTAGNTILIRSRRIRHFANA